MKTFVFIITPINITQLKACWPIFRLLPDFMLRPFFPNLIPARVSSIQQIEPTKKEIRGYMIVCPLTKIAEAGRIAKRLSANIIGFQGTLQALDQLKIPVTTGDTLAAWSIFEAIYRFSKAKNVNLNDTTIVIIGANFPAASLCARKLRELNPIEVVIEADQYKAAANADIIINVDDCTIALSRELSDKSGIKLIKAGLMKTPSGSIIPAALAETMLLALERKFTSYSSGDNINLDQLEEIADMAARNGYEVWVPEAPVI